MTTKTVGDALKMDAMFDQGRRPAALSFKNVANNKTVVDQAMGWNRVDLKTYEKKQDENGKGNRYEYDTLYRLRQVKENMADPENAGGAGEKETSYDIDGVENVISRVDMEKGVDKTAGFVVDNRNRITSYKGEALSYDANGNLQGFRGDQYIYDWKNQLVQVNTANGNVVMLNYDALGRRIGKSVSGSQPSNIRYIYDGWRIIEERDGSDTVKARYSHGNGIDELVEIEKAAAVPGQYDRYYPAQGTNGSTLAVTDANGEIAEKVNYSAYGKPVFVYDHVGPEVDVIRVEAGNIFIRFSEAVKRDKAQSALKIKIGTDTINGAVSFEDKDRLAKFAPSSALINGELSVEIGETLEDLAGNKIGTAVTKSVNYAGMDVIVFDRTSPSVESVKIVGNAVLVEFNEEIKAESVAGGIELKRGTNVAAGNAVLENQKTVKFTPTGTITPSVEYVITVKSTIQDLSGKGLSQSKTVSFTYSGSDEVLFAKPEPDQQAKSYIGNPYLFQGREFDAETNLYYFRARYLQPELGRFLQRDPMGYEDSMNLYQSFNMNGINYIDPLGKYFIVPNNDNNKDKILRALAIGALSEEGEKLFWKLFNDKRPITISSGELETNLQPFDLVKKRDNIIFKQVYGSIDSVIALKKWDTEHIVSEISITVSYKNLDNYFYTKNRFGYNFVNQGKLDKEGITTIYHELKHVEDFFSLEPTLSVEGAEKRVREGDLRIDSNGKIVEPRKYSVNSRAQLFGELVFNKSEKIDKKTREKQIEGIIDSLILKMQENGIFFTRGNK